MTEWTQVGGGDRTGNPILKWNQVGQVVEGTLLRTRQGKDFGNGPSTLADIKTGSGDVTITLTAVLKDKVGSIGIGGQVKIEYLGQSRTADGNRQVKLFNVFTKNGGEPKSFEAPWDLEAKLEKSKGKAGAAEIIKILKKLNTDPEAYRRALEEQLAN